MISFRAILMVSLTAVIIVEGSHTELEKVCPENCVCEETKINCTNTIPDTILRGIQSVVIFNPTKNVLFPRDFCKASWPDARQLTVHSINEDIGLVDNVFMCLDKIQVLKLQSEETTIVKIHKKSFMGLTSVSVLDLTRCERIWSKEIYNSMSEKSILPNLTRLILVGAGRAFDTIQWNQNFTNILGFRNITEINLSSTDLSIHVDDFTPLCDTLEKINISEARLVDSDINDEKRCPSLQTFDISGTHFPRTSPMDKHIVLENITIDTRRLKKHPLYETVSTIYANRLISPDHVISLINCTAEFATENNVREVHSNNYNIPYFDVEIKVIPDYLNYLDLSSNSIATIGPHVFRNLYQLTKLDLGTNTLSKCSSFSDTFSVLFQNNTNMVELNLANNGLTYVPNVTFARNKRLQRLDISANAFGKLTFDISHLHNLTLLDLRHNIIKSLDNQTMQSLDRLYEIQHLANRTKAENGTLFVDLRGNPLSCHCESLEFIQWFVRTPVFATTRHLYQCEIDGRHVAMNEAGVAEAKEDCEKPIRRRRVIILCSTIPTVCVAVAIIGTYLVITRRRKRLAYQQFEDTVKLIRDGDSGFQFPVFLSYSSEDQVFVLNHILEPLQNNLQSIVDIEKDLVCIGDRYFMPGHSLFTEITRCLENCAVIVAVMSLNYCKSLYCKLEIEQARIMGRPVIMIFIEDVDEKEMSEVMKEVFRNFTRVKIVYDGEGYQSQPDWPYVCQSVIQLL